MTSDMINHLNSLIERWETLSAAAGQKVEQAAEPIQGGFYAGVLFGLGVARDELVMAVASAMAEAAQTSRGMLSSTQQPPN